MQKRHRERPASAQRLRVGLSCSASPCIVYLVACTTCAIRARRVTLHDAPPALLGRRAHMWHARIPLVTTARLLCLDALLCLARWLLRAGKSVAFRVDGLGRQQQPVQRPYMGGRDLQRHHRAAQGRGAAVVGPGGQPSQRVGAGDQPADHPRDGQPAAARHCARRVDRADRAEQAGAVQQRAERHASGGVHGDDVAAQPGRERQPADVVGACVMERAEPADARGAVGQQPSVRRAAD